MSDQILFDGILAALAVIGLAMLALAAINIARFMGDNDL
jgi:hypothetical protein